MFLLMLPARFFNDYVRTPRFLLFWTRRIFRKNEFFTKFQEHFKNASRLKPVAVRKPTHRGFKVPTYRDAVIFMSREKNLYVPTAGRYNRPRRFPQKGANFKNVSSQMRVAFCYAP